MPTAPVLKPRPRRHTSLATRNSQTCRELRAAGTVSTETLLFNGDYYQQEVEPPGDFSRVGQNLRHGRMSAERAEPGFQIKDECIIDRRVGDTYA